MAGNACEIKKKLFRNRAFFGALLKYRPLGATSGQRFRCGKTLPLPPSATLFRENLFAEILARKILAPEIPVPEILAPPVLARRIPNGDP
jgi:hypothetical protein